MKLFALTGGISTGKSSTCKQFSSHSNVTVLDTDSITHLLQQKGKEGYKQICQKFPSVCNPSDENEKCINRTKLSALVFPNLEPNFLSEEEAKKNRRILEKIMHPLITKYLLFEVLRLWYYTPSDHVVIVDAPVLLETRKVVGAIVTLPFSGVFVCTCNPEIQLSRLMKRNNFTKEEAETRIKSQMSLQEKEKLADFIIMNNGSMMKTNLNDNQTHPENDPELRQQVTKALARAKKMDTTFNGFNRFLFGLIFGLTTFSALITFGCYKFLVYQNFVADGSVYGWFSNTFFS